nr:AzlC family ABC transporter permease [Limoniibacter endophyticus]
MAGVRLSLPLCISIAPFGALFGALAVSQGLSATHAVLMSGLIYAGASQMVGIELFNGTVPAWLIVLSVFAVNFRHVLYSAALGPALDKWPLWKQALGFGLLVDPQYAESEKKRERGLPVTFAWYLGLGGTMYVNWVVATWLGTLVGRSLPDAHTYGLDYLLAIYFLTMVLAFRHRRNWAPVVLCSGVVSMLAYNWVGSPWHVSIGAMAGIILAAMMAPAKQQRKIPEEIVRENLAEEETTL